MSLIAKLSKKNTPPEYAATLKPFSRTTVAEQIGCSYCSVCNILCGCRRPGPELERKFIELAAQVEKELKEQEG